MHLCILLQQHCAWVAFPALRLLAVSDLHCCPACLPSMVKALNLCHCGSEPPVPRGCHVTCLQRFFGYLFSKDLAFAGLPSAGRAGLEPSCRLRRVYLLSLLGLFA